MDMSEDPIIKQYPYDMKAEQLQSGLWKLSGHAYGESADQVVTSLVNMISMAETEMERKGKPLLNNTQPVIKEKKKVGS